MAAPPTGVNIGPGNWIPDILEMAQEACERAGANFTDAYMIRSVKRSLDILAISWANKGLNLWLLDEQTTPLLANTASYLLPADTIDLVFPTISTTQNGVSTDVAIAREDFTDYASIPNKTSTGRPTIVFVQRMQAQPQAFVWEVPDVDNKYTLIWWRLRRMANTGYPTNSMDIPWRFVPAMISGLAWQIALKKKIKDYNLIATLKVAYDQDLAEAQAEDNERSSIFITPYGYE